MGKFAINFTIGSAMFGRAIELAIGSYGVSIRGPQVFLRGAIGPGVCELREASSGGKHRDSGGRCFRVTKAARARGRERLRGHGI